MTTNRATGDLSRSLFFSSRSFLRPSAYREIRDNSHLCNEEILYVYFFLYVYDTVFARSNLLGEGGSLRREGEKEDGLETPVAA